MKTQDLKLGKVETVWQQPTELCKDFKSVAAFSVARYNCQLPIWPGETPGPYQ